MILVAEIVDFQRFRRPRALMGYLGLVPSEYSSGDRHRRGALTKAGNTHARRVLIEAAWHGRRDGPSSGASWLRLGRHDPPRGGCGGLSSTHELPEVWRRRGDAGTIGEPSPELRDGLALGGVDSRS